MDNFDDPNLWGAKNVVYKWDQVITESELFALLKGYLYLEEKCKWYQLIRKYQLKIAVNIIDNVIAWLEDGKHTNGEHE